MSNIVIFVDGTAIAASTLLGLQRITGRGLAEIRTAIGKGKPIFQREIFDANYEEHASMIRKIVACLKDDSVRERIYEIPEGETMESCSFAEDCQIDTEVLKSILDQADLERDRQLGE